MFTILVGTAERSAAGPLNPLTFLQQVDVGGTDAFVHEVAGGRPARYKMRVSKKAPKSSVQKKANKAKFKARAKPKKANIGVSKAKPKTRAQPNKANIGVSKSRPRTHDTGVKKVGSNKPSQRLSTKKQSAAKKRLADLRSSRKSAYVPAQKVNEQLFKDGYKYPPYKNGTKVRAFSTKSSQLFVRVYGPKTAQVGKWLMKYEDIKNLTASQIKDKFALPFKPTKMTFVNIAPNTSMRTGIAAGKSTGNPHGQGGGRQYELLSVISKSSFGETVLIGKK